VSSYVLIEFEAGWAGYVEDPQATMIGVFAEVDERPYIAEVDTRPFRATSVEIDPLIAEVSLPVYKAVSDTPPAPVAVVDETVGAVAVVDESRYGAIVSIPGKLIAKVDEWPS